jgi:Tol biopolymer transport system component
MRAAGWRRTLVASLCAGLLLASCSNPNLSVPPLRVLTLPGVRQVTVLTDLEVRTGSRHLGGLTTYTSALPPHDQRMLFTLGDALHDVGVETTDVIERPSCGVPYAVTSDGHWLVCRQFGNIALLDLATDSAHPHPSTQVLTYQDGDDPRSPTWGPDDRHLAVLSRMDGGCSIAIYRAMADYSAVVLTAVLALTSALLTTPTGAACDATGLRWSPDGRWFAFASGFQGGGLYVLSLQTLWPQILAAERLHEALHRQLGVDQVTKLPVKSNASLAWQHGSRPTLTFVGFPGDHLQQIDITTGEQATLFKTDETGLFGISWTPDDRHLVFGLGRGGEPLVTPPPDQLYVYTPPALLSAATASPVVTVAP